MALSTDSLVPAVLALGRDLRRARGVTELLAVAGASLEALGFDVVVLAVEQGQTWLRYASPRPAITALMERLTSGSPLGAQPTLVPYAREPGPEARLILDLPRVVTEWLRSVEGAPGAPLQGWRRRAVEAPLLVREQPWGTALFLHDELEPAHLDVLHLVALLLGERLELAEAGRVQAEAVRGERMLALQELARVVAHEVRNPLGVINNSLAILKRLFQPASEAELLLTMAGEEAERLNGIVTDLLEFVKPYHLVQRPVAVKLLVTQAVEAAAQALSSSRVEVVLRFPAELPPFAVDADLLRQALRNLLLNALQSMPRGGTVEVRGALEHRPDGAWLRLDFEDEGVGLKPEVERQLFRPFFTTKATGTGLGLAVVKRIIEEHRGEVSAAPNPGRGATFTVRLPPLGGRDGLFTPAVAREQAP